MSINLETIMQTTPEDLAELQEEQLRDAVCERLKHIFNSIRNKEYQNVLTYLESSPAGDGYGLDNKYIDFSYLLGDDADISDVITRLITLNKINNP